MEMDNGVALKTVLSRLARARWELNGADGDLQRTFLRAVANTVSAGGGADVIPRSTRLTFVNKLAWVLSDALSNPELPDETLVAAIKDIPHALEALCFDVRRRTFAPYMFWDMVIVGSEELLAPGGRRASLYRPLAGALLAQRFGTGSVLQDSATHGLFHLGRVSSSRDSVAHPP